ncbi:MAG: hypothetical protein IT381_32320 [Deltaproteobacteria bacterium]|nr:hypothetical protein [Deltaproteobacteria bacterium]
MPKKSQQRADSKKQSWPEQLVVRLTALHDTPAANPAVTIESFELGDGLSSAKARALLKRANARRADDGDEALELPPEVEALVRVVDGIDLRFSVANANGAISCNIAIVPLKDVIFDVGPAPIEDQLNWSLLSVTNGDAALGQDAGILFTDGDGCARSEFVPLQATVDTMVACLGVEGWELTMWSSIDDFEDEAREVAANLDFFRQTLRVETPRFGKRIPRP